MEGRVERMDGVMIVVMVMVVVLVMVARMKGASNTLPHISHP